MTQEDFTVLEGIGMVLAQISGIVASGYAGSKLRNHFAWIRRIAP